MTMKDNQIQFLKLRIESMENEIERLNGVVRSYKTQMMEQREKNAQGFKCDINDPLFHKPLKDIEVNL